MSVCVCMLVFTWDNDDVDCIQGSMKCILGYFRNRNNTLEWYLNYIIKFINNNKNKTFIYLFLH